MRRHHELPFGAELAPGGVRFRLWAPRRRSVSLLLERADPLPMRAEPAGWWSLTTDAAMERTRYCYLVDDDAFPDPASRFQPDGVHGASQIVDPGAYRWRDQAWHGRAWESLVIYEVHLGTFSESGDFIGAIAHLDHVAELGATAVELMPVAEFPGRRNWGYDGVGLFAPASCYGTPDELKALVEACHARGLAILLDVVYNHFGPEGNYLWSIAPEFFAGGYATPWGAAPAYEGPASRAVREFVVHNALYWLEEFHFDGLRLDAVDTIRDDSRPDILSEIAAAVRLRFPDREIHLVLENDRNEAGRLVRQDGHPHAYSAQWNDDLHHALRLLVTGQATGPANDFADRPIAHLGRALAQGFAFQGEASRYRGGRRRGEASAGLPATAFVSFLQNHDQVGNMPGGTRIARQVGDQLIHAAVAIVLLSPQIPLLFMGEEWGSRRPFLFFCDLAPLFAEGVRQGRRRTVARFAGGNPSDSSPDPLAAETFAVSRLDWSEPQLPAHARWLERYRRMLSLRSRLIAPRLRGMAPGGHFAVIGPMALHVEWRLGDGGVYTLLANFAPDPVRLDPPACGELVYCSAARPPAGELPPACAAFYLAGGGGMSL